MEKSFIFSKQLIITAANIMPYRRKPLTRVNVGGFLLYGVQRHLVFFVGGFVAFGKGLSNRLSRGALDLLWENFVFLSSWCRDSPTHKSRKF